MSRKKGLTVYFIWRTEHGHASFCVEFPLCKNHILGKIPCRCGSKNFKGCEHWKVLVVFNFLACTTLTLASNRTLTARENWRCLCIQQLLWCLLSISPVTLKFHIVKYRKRNSTIGTNCFLHFWKRKCKFFLGGGGERGFYKTRNQIWIPPPPPPPLKEYTHT